MNIIRTTAIELATIPAVAYKQKLASGGAGIKLFRLDAYASAVFTIDKRTGDALPYGKYDSDLFPDEAVIEAMELTLGLPYSARGKIRIMITEDEDETLEAEDVAETETEKIDMVGSYEYQSLTLRYTNEDGKINYTLMNKDFIQFASKSKVVAEMAANKAGVDEILLYIVQSRVADLSGKKNSLSEEKTAALIETMDEIDPRSAFKELKAYIKRLLARKK